MKWIKVVGGDQTVQFAATELQSFLKARGVQAAREQRADQVETITLGIGSDLLEDASWDRTLLFDQDLSQLCVQTDHYFIARRGNHTLIGGASGRAVLFGVYQFCKEFGGVEWIYPGVEPTLVKDVAELQSSEEGLRSFQPRFQRRGFVFETINEPLYIANMVDWLAKNGNNEIFFTFMLFEELRDGIVPEIQKRGMQLTLGGHSMKFFLENARLNTSALHPYTAKKQLDYANLDQWEDFIQQVINYCREIPVLARISLWPEDVATQQESGNFLQEYIRFTEYLQQRLHEAGLLIEVEHIAYNAGLSWKMLELEGEASAQINTLFAYWGRDYSKPVTDQSRAAEARANQALENWRRQSAQQGQQLTIFEYYSDHYILSHLFPPLPQRVAEDMDYYEQLGANGMVNLVVPNRKPEYYPWRWAHGLNGYCFSRLAWGAELEQIMQDYSCYYSEALRPHIVQLFARLEAAVAPISYWNVPLFPSRVVDEQWAEHPENQQIIANLRVVKELTQELLEQYVQDMHVSLHVYIKHLHEATSSLIDTYGVH